MIAFSFPQLPIITGKLRFPFLRRLFSNLATFPAFGRLTKLSHRASRRQKPSPSHASCRHVCCALFRPSRLCKRHSKGIIPPPFSVDLLLAPWYTTPKLFRTLSSFDLRRAPSSFPIRESPSADRKL